MVVAAEVGVVFVAAGVAFVAEFAEELAACFAGGLGLRAGERHCSLRGTVSVVRREEDGMVGVFAYWCHCVCALGELESEDCDQWFDIKTIELVG